MSSKILVISFSPLDRDPRVRRQIQLLQAEGYKVTAAGYTDPKIDGIEWWPIIISKRTRLHRLLSYKKFISAIKLKVGLFKSYYFSQEPVRKLLKVWSDKNKPEFDLLIANDVDALPVALDISGLSDVYLDAHEYSPEEWGSPFWKFFFSHYKDWQCETYLPKTGAMSTVCQGISEKYFERYKVESKVIFNAPVYRDLKPTPVDSGKIKLVHHGLIHRERGIEHMIEMLDFLDNRYELHFYLVGKESQPEYARELEDMANERDGRVIFHEPVVFDAIPEELNRYDIGVFLLKPSNFNYYMALPNKFFEFIQARLAIAIGPSPEMSRIVKEHSIGVVAEDFLPESMAAEIMKVSSDEISTLKENSSEAANILSYESQAPIFLSEVNDLTGNS